MTTKTKALRMPKQIDQLHVELATAIDLLLADIAKRDGEGNMLPDHLPSMRGAVMALDIYRRVQGVNERMR